MEYKFILILMGIILPIIYMHFEIWACYGFEPFAFNIGININIRKIKTEVESFDILKDNIYTEDGLNYKFIFNNINIHI